MTNDRVPGVRLVIGHWTLDIDGVPPMNLAQELHQACGRYLSRRWFLHDCGVGLAGIAASALLANDAGGTAVPAVAHPAAGNPLAPRPPHYTARARPLIYPFHAGAPGHPRRFDHHAQLT